MRAVMLADEISATSTHLGKVILLFEHANIRLQKVLFTLNLGYNLVLTGKLAKINIRSLFRRTNVVLGLETTNFFNGLDSRDKASDMYMLLEPVLEASQLAISAFSKSKPQETDLRHRHLAHMNMNDLASMHKHADGVPEL